MADLVFVVILVAFFVLAAGLVRACDRIIGPAEHTSAEDTRAQDAAHLDVPSDVTA
jgi:hypothetical protein